MCRGISMVVTRGRIEPYWIDGNNNHSDIRRKFNIKDNTVDYPSLPIEMLPIGVLTNYKEWELKVDISDELPLRFTEKEKEYQWECKAILKNVINGIKNSGIYDGYLDLRDTQITSLGNLTEVSGYLDLQGCNKKLIRESIKLFGKDNIIKE